MIEGRRIDDPARAEAFGLNAPFTLVEFDIELVPTEQPELQTRHQRPRALENETA